MEQTTTDTPEARAIDAAHPVRTGRYDLYEEAMRLVGARHSKGDLVLLVNWLLARADVARREERKPWNVLREAADVLKEHLRPAPTDWLENLANDLEAAAIRARGEAE